MSLPVSGFPFSAVVGHDEMRLALVLNAVSPGIGGVLVRGEKGTAKSTVVRGLAALLPELDVVAGCRFGCDPASPEPACPDGPHGAQAPSERRRARLVELPVGATEDRLVGSLDIERALGEGVKAYEPGLLAAAHRGLLYADEVNLLHDHIVDLLLDAAAMGVAHVEREGVSVRHAARFLLVGTMNPEEGELRPQLLDRFGLTVEVHADRDPADRAEVVRRRLAYDADQERFAASWAAADAELAARIASARSRLPDVTLADGELLRIARVCAAFEVDGMRADLVTARTAMALAAWNDRDQVTRDDVRQAALLALPHRRRRNPFDAPGLDEDLLDRALDDDPPDDEPPPGDNRPKPQPQDQGEQTSGDAGEQQGASPGTSSGTSPGTSSGEGSQGSDASEPARAAALPNQPSVAAGDPYRTRLLAVPGVGDGAAGRRSRSQGSHGQVTGWATPEGKVSRPHLAATVLAAAPHQIARGRVTGALRLRSSDLREAVREGREGNLVLFLVDASGSMAAQARMRAVKGAVLSLLLDAYQRRDKVGLVTFRGTSAEVVLPPTSSVEAGAARLDEIATGGRTPLAAGLLAARDVLRVEKLRDPRRRALLVVVTDGRATSPRGVGDPLADADRAAAFVAKAAAANVVVDCEQGIVRLGLATRLANKLEASVVRLEDLAADSLASVVRDVRRAA